MGASRRTRRRSTREWGEAVDEVHASGAHAGVLLTHAGRRGSTRPSARGADLPLREGGWPLLAPSPIPYAPRMPAPREMDADAMTSVCDAFAAAARRAAGAGFDVLELDMGHGYLLASFLSPESNRREDEYGGDLAGRLRFPLQVLDAVREAWPEDRLLAVRLNVMDGTRHGLKLPDGIAIARELAAHGCGLVHVVAGQTVPEAPQADYRRGFLTPLADRVRAEARVPTLVGGYLTTPDEANTILGAGRADLCLLDVPDTELERQVLARPSQRRRWRSRYDRLAETDLAPASRRCASAGRSRCGRSARSSRTARTRRSAPTR